MNGGITVTWTGVSGKKYEYSMNTIGTTFKPIAGNYIFAREVRLHEWMAIYVGETDNLQESLESHEKMSCIQENGARHIHVHTSDIDERVRREEADDIIAKWNPPCNIEPPPEEDSEDSADSAED
jgi:hypothetical protein